MWTSGRDPLSSVNTLLNSSASSSAFSRSFDVRVPALVMRDSTPFDLDMRVLICRKNLFLSLDSMIFFSRFLLYLLRHFLYFLFSTAKASSLVWEGKLTELCHASNRLRWRRSI